MFIHVCLFFMVQFYQDTLETDETPGSESKAEVKSEISEDKAESSVKEEPGAEESKDDVEMASADENSGDRIDQQVMDETSSHSTDGSKPKGVLVIHSQMKNRTKKSVLWRSEDELEMYHYFELDETERGNLISFNFFKKSSNPRKLISQLSLVDLIDFQFTFIVKLFFFKFRGAD